MQAGPLNLKKGNYVLHTPTNTVGVISKVNDPFLFIDTPDGRTVKIAYYPINFMRYTKKEYDHYLFIKETTCQHVDDEEDPGHRDFYCAKCGDRVNKD